MQPTDEQQHILDLFQGGLDLAIEAGAGTGKTTTLTLVGQLGEGQGRRGQYIAFNNAIVAESKRKFPESVTCMTAHGMAMRAVGRPLAHRLKSERMLSKDVADMLRLRPVTLTVDGKRKLLRPGYLAGLVNRTIANFCNSADEVPEEKHVPYIEGIDPLDQGKRTWANNRQVRKEIGPALAKAWADLTSVDGKLRFTHDVYLKMWQLSGPKIWADYLLFDEAQDASAVMLDIVAQQAHAQKVYVGDTQQQIYEWRGAVNALASLENAQTAYLSQSFRFGPAIAEAANMILTVLDAELRLTGSAPYESRIGPCERPDAYLHRTNAGAFTRMLHLIEAGRRPHLVGGGKEILSFARGVEDLQRDGFTTHPELACFDSWYAVLDYVSDDEQGSELKVLVDLVMRFGVKRLRAVLESMPAEEAADVVVSTAHKGKGREWDAVYLGDDFPEVSDTDADWRLLYVATTRAKRLLDHYDCQPLAFLFPTPERQVS